MEQERLEQLLAGNAHPDDLFDAHATLRAQGLSNDAERVLAHLEERCCDDAAIALRLARVHADHERTGTATTLYTRALELDPKLDSARGELFALLLAEGELAEADRLLVPHMPALREALVEAYYAKGHSAKASSLEVWDDAQRGDVAVGPGGEVIPFPTPEEQRRSRKSWWLSWLIAFAAAVLLGVAYSAERRFHVVNATLAAVELQLLRGEKRVGTWEVGPGEHAPIDVQPGEYVVVVHHEHGTDRVPLDLSASLRERLSSSRAVHVINVAGAAALLHERTAYADPTRLKNPDVYGASLRYGETYTYWEDVDYRFQPFPDLQTTRYGLEEWRTRVSMLPAAPHAAVNAMPTAVDPFDVLGFLEHRLRLRPQDAAVRELYHRFAEEAGQGERAASFFRDLGR